MQLLATYLLMVVVLRQTIPGSLPSGLILGLTITVGIGIQLLTSAAGYSLSPTHADERFWTLAAICISLVLILSLAPMAAFLFLAVKGLAAYPVLTGLILGLGSGLSGEAAWRLHCHVTSWDHILFGHIPGIIAAVFVGTLVGYLFLNKKPHFQRRHQD
jgi:hypothetical protein